MNGLVLGRCPKTAEQLSTFCSKVIIVLDNSFPGDRFLPELNDFEIIFSGVNISSAFGIPRKVIELRKIIKEHEIDIVFSNTKWDMVSAKIASISLRRKVFLLAANHNSYAWLEIKDVKRFVPLIKMTTDYYVALASFVREMLIDIGLNEDKVILVPNTIGFEKWQTKVDYSFSSCFRIAYVAYVYPGKRQDMLVEAAYVLSSKYDICIDCFGEIEGNKEYVSRVYEKIDQYGLSGKVNLMGPIDNGELRTILYQYDAYVSTSQMEMSPVNILEAQAAGLPVIAANVGGTSDIITDNGTGLLFDPYSLEDLVSKIECLIKDEPLRRRLGESGRKRVSEEYTHVQAGNLIANAIRKL